MGGVTEGGSLPRQKTVCLSDGSGVVLHRPTISELAQIVNTIRESGLELPEQGDLGKWVMEAMVTIPGLLAKSLSVLSDKDASVIEALPADDSLLLVSEAVELANVDRLWKHIKNVLRLVSSVAEQAKAEGAGQKKSSGTGTSE